MKKENTLADWPKHKRWPTIKKLFDSFWRVGDLCTNVHSEWTFLWELRRFPVSAKHRSRWKVKKQEQCHTVQLTCDVNAEDTSPDAAFGDAQEKVEAEQRRGCSPPLPSNQPFTPLVFLFSDTTVKNLVQKRRILIAFFGGSPNFRAIVPPPPGKPSLLQKNCLLFVVLFSHPPACYPSSLWGIEGSMILWFQHLWQIYVC